MRALFSQAVAQIYQVVETPYPVYFDQARTCIRILARLLPCMIESRDKRIHQILWAENIKKPEKQHLVKSIDNNSDNAAGVITGGNGVEAVVGEDTQESEDGGISARREPLAVILVNSLLHMLFLPDFTIEDPNMDFGEEVRAEPCPTFYYTFPPPHPFSLC